MTAVHSDGHVATGFGRVADAFLENFAERGDTGAACSVYANGELVVDLWAGSTGRAPWTRDTRSVLFSVSKGITTICLLMAGEAGLLALDAPVAQYWPEFAANGKGAVTVRQVLAHQAGLIAPDEELTVEDLRAWTPVPEALARQRPLWQPGTAWAYHALTVGWLAGEVLRRATGMRPGEWLREHIALPLALEMTFGAHPDDPNLALLGDQLPSQQPVDLNQDLVELRLQARVMGMNGGFDGTNLFNTANSADFLTSELPAANLVSSAHDLARLYAATVGEIDGVRLLQRRTVEDARHPLSVGAPFFGADEGNRWATGFMIESVRRQMAGQGSFGHDGAGGQLGFANLERQVAFGYQTIRPGGVPDDRAEQLCQALRACL